MNEFISKIRKKKSPEEDRLKKPLKKNWILTNKHRNIERFTEATSNEIQEEINKTIKILKPMNERAESNTRIII